MSGFRNVIVTRVIIRSGAPSTGLFVYNGAPGPGNTPIASITNEMTDPYGNAVNPVIAAYDASGNPTNLTGTGILTRNNGHNVGALSFIASTASWYLQRFSAFSTLISDPLNAVLPGSSPQAPESWHTVAAASFAAGFASGIPAARYQLEPIGGGRVRLTGSVVLTANQLAGAAMFMLPAAYTPTSSQTYVTQNNLSGFALGGNSVTVTSGGAVQIGPAGTNGDFVRLDGIVVELD